MKGNKMKRMLKLALAQAWTVAGFAATGTSQEFRLDLTGLGPWETHTADVSQYISYSSEWATNALADAKANVKAYPVLRPKPKYVAIDISGGTAAARYPVECFDEIPGGAWPDEYKTSKLVLRHIPAGSFIMGGRATDSTIPARPTRTSTWSRSRKTSTWAYSRSRSASGNL